MAEYLCEEDMSTGEYISRDVALRQLNATCLATECNNYNGVMCRACAYADAMDFIDAIPAEDVQPVKHGKWELTDNPSFRKCSECGAWWSSDITDNYFTNYCPKCGTRMMKDGDAE